MKHKKLFAILTLVCFMFTLMPVAAFAGGEVDAWDGSVDTSWTSETAITTAGQLAYLAKLVNDGETFKGKTVTLGADIDLGSKEWTPIGNSTNKFQGTFDGGSKTISNLVITGNNNNAGLFGFTTNGEIKNLAVENANVSGYLNVGVVAGTPYTSKYTNITVKGHVEVNGMAYVGGVGGKNVYADWTNITVDVDDTSYVKADSVEDGKAYRTYVGGVIGFMGEGSHKVSNVTSNIDVIGSTKDVGGITGIAHYGNTFENCSCTADVTIDNNIGETEIGGIAGVWHNNTGSTVTFSGCSYTGTLTSPGVTEFANGGLTGSAYNTTGTGTLDAATNNSTSGATLDGSIPDNMAVAKVGDTNYADLQEAIVAAAPSGTVKILKDVTVDKWIMFAEELSIGNGNLITQNINGLTINGNNHTLTINSIESAGNGNRLFYDAENLNINNLTIEYADGVAGGIGLQSGAIENVTFIGGTYGVLPQNGAVTIQGCTFKTNGTAIYFEEERNNLIVTGNTFELGADTNVILLRGDTAFTDNTIISGRTVNVVSGSPTVTGNTFADGVRLKVYNDAEATIENNTITVLAFNDESEVKSTFANNILSADAKAVLLAAGCAFTVTYTDGVEDAVIFDDVVYTVESSSATPAFDGTPTRSGYTFAGWEPEVAATVTTNSVYTATWTKNSTSYYYGGGTSASVSIASNDNATVKVSDKYADKGETVTITVDTKDGFYAKDVVVTDKNGEAITVTRVALDKWTFTMPSGKVKVDVDTAACSKEVVLQIGDLDIAVNDTVIQSDVAPFIKNDRTMVPISVIVYALGGTTDWDGETRTVTVTLDGKVLTMVIDEIIPGFGAAAIIVDSRTYVPIGYVADVLGCDVDWIAAARQVVIVK